MLSPTLRNMLEAPPEAGRADVDGSYFVDRDAKIFEEIIHFLRYGNLSMNCQKDHDLRRLLAHDAEYFQACIHNSPCIAIACLSSCCVHHRRCLGLLHCAKDLIS